MSDISIGVNIKSQKAEAAFKYVIQTLSRQHMNQPIAMSLLEYTGQAVDIADILTMSSKDINDLYYIKVTTIEEPKQPGQKEESSDGKPTSLITTRVKTDLAKGSKRLIKVLIAFNRYMIDQGNPIYYDWSNITQDQFDDYRLGIHNSDETTTSSPNVTSTNETYNSKNTPDKADTPSFEIAFERAIVVMFNQYINGPISTFFTTTYNRRNISDITNPDLIDYKNPLHFQLKYSNLNQSERDLILTLFLCNREFLKTYGHEIDNNWSNVSPYMFDEIGENYGFDPIDCSMILPPTITPSKLRSSDSSKSVHDCAETTHFVNKMDKKASNIYKCTHI